MFVCVAFAGGDQRKALIEFDNITFSIGKLYVTMSPVYGKVYGKADAIEVSWTTIHTDSTGRVAVFSDAVVIPVANRGAGAYFEAKALFEKKHVELQELFEREYLPKEKKK